MSLTWFDKFSFSLVFLTFMAHPLAAQEGVQPSRTVATYENWSIACNLIQITPAEGDSRTEELCELVSQVNFRGEDGVTRPLLQVVVGRAPGAEMLRLLIQVPGNAYLREPVALILNPAEDLDPSAVPDAALMASYIRCDTGRCIADTQLDKGAQSALSAADSAIVSFVNVTGARVGVPLSMNGYKAAAKDMMGR